MSTVAKNFNPTSRSALTWLSILLAIVVAWRMVVVGIGQHYAQDAAYDPTASEQAISWRVANSAAFYRRATAPDINLATRVQDLQTALQFNPADGRILATLTNTWRLDAEAPHADHIDRSDRAAKLAARLLPLDANAQLQAAEYWMNRGATATALQHWDAALRANRNIEPQLFPALLHAAENSASAPTFFALLRATPPWWPEFFAYAAENAARSSTLSMLYAARRESTQAPTLTESHRYMTRLQQEGRWHESFYVWLMGLDEELRRNLGQPYNGGFERPATNAGFDWHVPQYQNLSVEFKRTFGASETRALHLVFRSGHLPVQALYQPMLLGAARYRLRGRIRLDSLNGNGGIHWQLSCTGTSLRPIARTEAFIGADQWRAFSVEFTVPTSGCDAQILSLEDAGDRGEHSQLNGSVWFDDFQIERV